MTTELATVEEQHDVVAQQPKQVLNAIDLRRHVNLIQEAMKGIMKPETHYGVIPGTKKNTLYKAGSEVLLTMFRISVDPQVEDLSTHNEVRYRVKAVGTHQISGIVVGTGVGECSSNEEKYRWRKAVCDEEFAETEEHLRRKVYKRGREGIYTILQVRTHPSDVANTVLKMAKKRAQIDLTLTATAASDIFTQDLEDASPEMVDTLAENGEQGSRPAPQQPQRTNTAMASEKQCRMIFARLTDRGLDPEVLLTRFDIPSLDDLPKNQVDAALAWIDGQ